MNRMELINAVIEEGKKRNIIITKLTVYDRGSYLEFFPTIKNDTAKDWVYKHQVEELIADITPLERQHKIGKIDLEWRKFNIGDPIEVESLWIRLNAGEKEPKDILKVGSAAGQWRSGWITGTIVETPEQNDRALVAVFSRDVWVEQEHAWWGSADGIEQAVIDGKIKKIDAGQPVYCGVASWDVRKP